MASIDEILNKLEKQTNISRTELESRIDKMHKELSGVVSKEGAAHLVAKEFGIKLNDTKKKIEMINIISGMRNVNAIGRIFRISNVVEFKRSDGSSGKVVNLYVSDGTSFVKVALWDGQVKLVEEETVKLGDVIEISNAFAKENMFGDVELSIGKYGNIQIADYEMPEIEELNKRFLSNAIQRAQIKDIIPGLFEIRASIAQIFRSSFIFRTCSICGNALNREGKCNEHGEVQSNPELVISAVVDDGTGDLRVVFFRDVAEKLIGISPGDFSNLDQDRKIEILNEKLLGKELLLMGRVKKNKVFDRLEIIANDFKEVDAVEESNKLIDEIQLKIGE